MRGETRERDVEAVCACLKPCVRVSGTSAVVARSRPRRTREHVRSARWGDLRTAAGEMLRKSTAVLRNSRHIWIDISPPASPGSRPDRSGGGGGDGPVHGLVVHGLVVHALIAVHPLTARRAARGSLGVNPFVSWRTKARQSLCAAASGLDIHSTTTRHFLMRVNGKQEHHS